MNFDKIYKHNNIKRKTSSSKRLFIRYKSGCGEVTERYIHVNLADVINGYGFDAFCELRNAIRTFRFDRINECIDMESGEFLNFDLAINKTCEYLQDTSRGGLENALMFYSGDVVIKDKEFVLTGKFINYPNRKKLEDLIVSKGGLLRG